MRNIWGRHIGLPVLFLLLLAGCGASTPQPARPHTVEMRVNRQGYQVIETKDGKERVVEEGGK